MCKKEKRSHIALLNHLLADLSRWIRASPLKWRPRSPGSRRAPRRACLKWALVSRRRGTAESPKHSPALANTTRGPLRPPPALVPRLLSYSSARVPFHVAAVACSPPPPPPSPPGCVPPFCSLSACHRIASPLVFLLLLLLPFFFYTYISSSASPTFLLPAPPPSIFLIYPSPTPVLLPLPPDRFPPLRIHPLHLTFHFSISLLFLCLFFLFSSYSFFF